MSINTIDGERNTNLKNWYYHLEWDIYITFYRFYLEIIFEIIKNIIIFWWTNYLSNNPSLSISSSVNFVGSFVWDTI
jgi:hypothetical protein